MTDEKLIIAVAKLDGITFDSFSGDVMVAPQRFERPRLEHFKSYLTSYDAIIPVIRRQMDNTYFSYRKFIRILLEETDDNGFPEMDILTATPKQLSIALVKATGNWEE